VTIPRFEDVLAATNLPIIVELKTPDQDCRRAVSQILQRAGARDRVCIGAVADEPAAAIRAEMPDVALFSPDRAARAFVAAALRGARPPETGYDVLALPDREGSLNLVDSRIVTAAKQAGIPLQLWTINDEARMRECLALGVDGIQTDRPDLLRAVISDFRE
jgi:glycerophosphoryl diester phosphodiesterase